MAIAVDRKRLAYSILDALKIGIAHIWNLTGLLSPNKPIFYSG